MSDCSPAEIASSIVDEIKKELKGDDLVEELSLKISEIVYSRLNAPQVETESLTSNNHWLKGEDYYVCSPCMKFSDCSEAPSNLKKFHKKIFGYVKTNQTTSHLNRSIKEHNENELHKWCVHKACQSDAELKNVENENKKVGRQIIRNGLFCLNNSLSSHDFVKLNDKDNLTEGLTSATKNDSTAEYFKIRELAYKSQNKRMHNFFQTVKSAAVTLDKVTTTYSYQVILTFFFKDGKIYVFLNKVDRLHTDDYDAVGTAKKVVQVLKETLGLTTMEVATKVKHFIYDGVYSTPEERVKGGGCLSLIYYFADEVGLQRGDVTGEWDKGHKLQLMYADVFKLSADIRETLQFIFDSMKGFTSGQGASLFQETAEKLNQAYLKCQKPQVTRFVRAVLRAIHASLFNLPVLSAVAANELKANLQAKDNTAAKAAQKTLDSLTNGKNLAMVVGLGQILEGYAEVSLQSQSSCSFPTTVLKATDKARTQLEKYSENWYWEEKPLKLSGIGSPKKLIDNLLLGTYKPYATEAILKRHAAWNSIGSESTKTINEIQNQLEENEVDTSNTTPIEIMPKFGTGEIVVTDFDTDIKAKVEQKLSKICKSLVEAFDLRMKTTELQSATLNIFDSKPPENEVTIQDLENLISLIPGPSSAGYSAAECLPGYQSWRALLNKEFQRDSTMTLEKLWEIFVKKYKNTFENCIDLFEDLHIRTMSEAMAETVGSMMNTAISRGRNPHPLNLSIELCLRFNLPPLHCLNNLIDEIYEQRKVEYIRRLDSKRPDKLISSACSAAIYNFRENQSSHLPTDLWE